MLSQDCQQLIMQAVMLPTARSASAARHYLPRLSDALQRYPAVAVTELEEMAGQWQERRSRYIDDQPARFTLVEPLPVGAALGGGDAGTTVMNRSAAWENRRV